MPILDKDNLQEQFDKAHTAMKIFWDPFYEYERIARNRPHPKVIAAKLPTVTDGTLAGIIIAQPKRVIQRLPTGGLVSIDQPDLAEIADFIWNNEIIPHATTNGDMLLKSWIMMSKALTYGSQFSYQFFRNHGDGFSADFKIPYIKDLVLEQGKNYGPDCNVLWLRQWYTEGDIKRIIDKEDRLTKNSKRRKDGDEYNSPWDIKKLKQLLDQAHPKDADALSPAESEKSPDAKYIEIVHCFERGVKSTFYSIAPDLSGENNSGGKASNNNIVRTWTNPDPRGKMPISFLYADIDLSNPLGRGHVELSGAMQNMIDSEVQSYQLLQKILLNPPVMKWGDNIRGSTIKYKPNAVWDMGNDPASKIEVVNITNEAIANFPNNYGLMKSQILALTHNNESTVSSEAGNTQSKTHAGVQQVESTLSFDDNYMRRQFGLWFQDNGENMLNLHFALSDGKEEIDLTTDFIEQQTPNLETQPKQVSIDVAKKKATVDYSQIKTGFKFTIDPTTAEDEDTETQLQQLNTLLQETSSNPYIYYYMLNDGYQLKLGEAYKDMFKRLGVEGIDKIVVKLPEGSDTAEELRGVMNPLYDKPHVDVPYIALPPSGQIQAAANAGITLTLQDVMGGPVIDPNFRGAAENAAMPGVQVPVANPAFGGVGAVPDTTDIPGAPQPAGATTPPTAPNPGAPVSPGQASNVPHAGGINPNAVAQDQKLAAQPIPATQPTDSVIPPGMNPNDPKNNPTNPNGMIPANELPPPHPTLARNAVGGLKPANDDQAQELMKPQPNNRVMPQPGLNSANVDQEVAKQLIVKGYSNQQIVDAIVLLNHGRSDTEVLQAIGPPKGAGK